MAEGDDVEVQATRTPKHERAAIEGGTGGENVINQDDVLARIQGSAGGECKGIFEVGLRARLS